MNKVTCQRDFRALRIYINDSLHFEMLMDNHDAIHSWMEGSSKCMYFIEFYRKTGTTIKLEYEDKSIWENILILINKNL
jgi:hypothetical protein